MSADSPDDGAKDRGPEGANGQAMLRLESQIDGILDRVEMLEKRVDDLEDENDSLRDQLDAERRQRKELKRDLDARIGELDNRTDMMRHVEDAEQSSGERRAVALLQHLRRKAEKKRREGDEPKVRIDREQAASALHHPEIDRTTYYDDMRRVSRFVGDADACWYDGGELYLDLTNGPVRLPKPRDDRGRAPQTGDSAGVCGASTTDSTAEEGRDTAADGGTVSNQTRTD